MLTIGATLRATREIAKTSAESEHRLRPAIAVHAIASTAEPQGHRSSATARLRGSTSPRRFRRMTSLSATQTPSTAI
jgi:hypothetical protein